MYIINMVAYDWPVRLLKKKALLFDAADAAALLLFQSYMRLSVERSDPALPVPSCPSLK